MEVFFVNAFQINTIPDTSSFDREIVLKYSRIVFIADKQYRAILKNFRHPNVTLMADENLKLNDLEEYLAATIRKAPKVKTLYLIATGIHTFTSTSAANLCLLNSCKNPLQAISYVAIEEFCNLPKICGKKLLTILSNLKDYLPMESNVAILPPLPLQLLSTNISHSNLHAGITMFPDYVIANFEFAVRKYYPVWMDSISSLALTSLVNCNLQQSCFQRIITDKYKKVEMIENFKSCSSEANTKWKKLIADIVGIVLEDKDNLQCPINNEFCEKLECSLADKIFEHLVFILSPASLKLLPDITAYTKYISFWHIDDIIESRNIFIKITELNKMALKNVLFVVLSDVTMIALVEEHPSCIVRNCEHKLLFCRLQANSLESEAFESKLQSLLSSIKIIISEIKMLSSFTSKIIIAPFTPKIYTLVSDANDEDQHNNMHEYIQKKNYISFLYGTTTSNWANLLFSFSIKWKLLASQVLCKDDSDLNKFMNVLNAKVANLTLISWRILSECSFDDDYTAISFWQLYILILIHKAFEKSKPLQTTAEYIEKKWNYLQRNSQDLSLKSQQQNLGKNKAIISCDDSQNNARNSGTLVQNKITEVSGKHISHISPPILGKESHRNHQIEDTLNNTLVIQGTNSVCRKEDKIAVVGKSISDKALLQENLPITPGKLMKSATPKEGNADQLSLLNNTLGSSSASLAVPLMSNYKNVIHSASETLSPESGIPSPDLAHKKALPIVPITKTGNKYSDPPAHRPYLYQYLVPILCKADSEEHNIKREAKKSTNFNTPMASVDSSCSDQSTCNKSRSVSPNKKNTSYDHVNIKSSFLSPSSNKEPTLISIAIKKENISPDNLKTCAFESSLFSTKSVVTPEWKAIAQKIKLEQSTENILRGCVHNVEETSSKSYSASKDRMNALSSNPQNASAIQKSYASEHVVSKTTDAPHCKSLILAAVSDVPKKIFNPFDNFVKSVSEIEGKKSLLTSPISEKNFQGSESINLSITNQNESLISETKEAKLSAVCLAFLNDISSPGGYSRKHTHSTNKACYKAQVACKENQKQKSGSLVLSKKRSRSPRDSSDSKSHFYFKSKKLERSRSRSSSHHKKSRYRSSSYHKKSKDVKNFKSKSYHRKSRSRSTSHKKSRSRSSSYKKSRSRSTSYHKKSRSRSTSYHKKPRSRSTSYHKKPRSRSTSKHKKSRSRSTSKHKKSRSKSTSYHKKPRSRSTSYHKKPRSRSTSKHKKSRSRSTSKHKKLRSKSTGKHKKSKYGKKSNSKNHHGKKLESSLSSPTSKKNESLYVENSTVEDDIICQSMKAALRKQIGEKLFKKYTKDHAKMRVTFEAESLAYEKTPQKHPNFKNIYKLFKDLNVAHGNVDKHHVKKLWKVFWGSQYEEIKSEDWKGRQIQLIKKYEQKVPSKSSFLLSKPTISDNEATTFSFDKALILLETLCQKASFMSHAISAIVKLCQDLGTTTKQAYNIINDSENLLLINMVLEKFKDICSSTADDDQYLYQMAIDWIPKLLKEAKNNSRISVEEIPIDLQAMAHVSAGKDSKFMVDLITTALEYEGISNPSVELITEIVRKICAINCT